MAGSESVRSDDASTRRLRRLVREGKLTALAEDAAAMPARELIAVLERLSFRDRAVVFRVLPKSLAIEVFDRLDPAVQADVVQGLHEVEVTDMFGELDPEDRAVLLDELPASVASRLVRALPDDERTRTSVVLGYPARSIGRHMSSQIIVLRADDPVAEALERVRARLADAETVYTMLVVDDERRLIGTVALRDVLGAAEDSPIASIMRPADLEADAATVTESAELAARRCADRKLLALPIVDAEGRAVGILTVEDALSLLEDAESEDVARSAGSEPLRRPYLSTPVRKLVISRVVWLFVLAIGATLTVQVLEGFEETIAQMVVLSVFIPLLIGTGGNTGNQAATTVTRALALGDVTPRDILAVLARESRTGLSLGVVLGGAGFAVASLFYGPGIGAVIGLTLLCICTLAASVGGVMPLVGKAIRVDPAVFSNPFITTFVDAAGLVVYFLIARAVLGL
ncbi:magnesium transporter [Agrococcus sp. Marseille-Q4369]|uniref:magnesium transporter n=1 Tax=Agrococcus sp. Marseille-Q4369 TaxID=2810513 RepID=UPI001B8BA46B|nr:magnesium transporter [Agrococcus sp. Marseille-Q4369]QUW18252.1 magnesium transporter [Agrococcus sp. Marseille-Q4369]